MSRFSKKIPAEDGWYWIRYEGKHGRVECPAQIVHLSDAVVIRSARNDIFAVGRHHRQTDPTLRIWPEPIRKPNTPRPKSEARCIR